MTTWTFTGTPNGDGHRIIVPASTGPITSAPIAEGYSRWKEWVQAGNAQWPEAFDNTIGGNDLGGGQSLDGYFFIRNDLGWRIRPDEADGQLDLVGNLYPFDPLTPFVVPTVAAFTVAVRQVLSSRAIVDSSSGAGHTQILDRLNADEELLADGTWRALQAGTNTVLAEKQFEQDCDAGTMSLKEQ